MRPRKLFIGLIVLVLAGIFVWRMSQRPEGTTDRIAWGIAFSKPFASEIGLDWRSAYLKILDGLQVKRMRLPVYWQDVEPARGEYDFRDYDWMIRQADQRGVRLTLVVGRKVPRWPECNIPLWAADLDEDAQQELVLKLIAETVQRYLHVPNLERWQVENEPFLGFGQCPRLDVGFLDEEIVLVRSLDPARPIIVTDSGELSVWLQPAARADIFGTTMYRIIWSKYFGYVRYTLLTPRFFWFKANLVRLAYPNKPIIVSELQAEPWGPEPITSMSLEEQFKSLNLEQFRDNIRYAREVGFPEAYLWGAEWWLWMKDKQGHPEFWNEAGKLLSE